MTMDKLLSAARAAGFAMVPPDDQTGVSVPRAGAEVPEQAARRMPSSPSAGALVPVHHSQPVPTWRDWIASFGGRATA